MSFDIPVAIEPDIIQYARIENLTEHEAIVRLIQAGLNATRTEPSEFNAILSGLGLFADTHDAAVLDEAVAMAYEERHRPSAQLP